MRTLLLGECLVDLVCERPVADLAEADSFVPHAGGAGAALAAACAAAGAPVALWSAVGDDGWGRWLVAQLASAGVDTAGVALVRGAHTPVTPRTVTGSARTTPGVLGSAGAEHPDPPAPPEFEAVLAPASAGTPPDADGPRVVHMDLSSPRFGSPAEGASASRALVDGAFCVCADVEDARLLTGERAPEAAAAGLLAAGAAHVLLRDEDGGALLRGGGMRLDAPPVAATPVDLAGAAEAFTATCLEHLLRTDFYPAALAAALPRAVHAAARASETWGSVPWAAPSGATP